MVLTASLISTSCIGPQKREINELDQLYILFEEDIIGDRLGALHPANDGRHRLLRKVNSRLHGYYFFYTSNYLAGEEPVRFKVEGTLLKSPEKSKAVFGGLAMPSSSSDDLQRIYGADEIRLSRSGREFRLAVRRSRTTYYVEVTGVDVAEEDFREMLIRKLGAFKEENLTNYPPGL